MSDILYNFGSNLASLDDINGHIGGVNQVAEDIDSVFKVLGTVYEGQAASALMDAHNNMTTMLQELLQNMAITQQQAQQQQADMQQLDAKNAAQF
jgi:uncharacterized protein YukE